MTVWFVDTSVLCNLIPVPGKDQDRETAKQRMAELQSSGDAFILPLTAVVETGNHISQLNNGYERRKAASTLDALLRLVMQGKAPWRLHAFSWDENFLGSLVEGAGTGMSLVDLAMTGVGCGDLCILAEREIYRTRTGIRDVRVWALDEALLAHS
ncbi:hypothetical protein AB0F83_28235 [Micromonospora chalcea]|uniref:hypothetical protein n=1 Tax=Micromonospora chalcea TaxID=1874 RepID=UPI0033DA567B